jgi:hypothetical protein
MAYVLMAWAQFERRRIGQRTKEALAVSLWFDVESLNNTADWQN